MYTGTRKPAQEFVWPTPKVEYTKEQRIGFCMTLMYRAVFHNRRMLDMATVSLGKLLEGNKAECGLLAELYELCEIQNAEIGVGVPPESPEISAAMKALDSAVAKLSATAKPAEPGYAFMREGAKRVELRDA